MFSSFSYRIPVNQMPIYIYDLTLNLNAFNHRLIAKM